MKKGFRKLLALVCSVVILSMSFGITLFASSFKPGDNITFTQNGADIVISGYGRMYDNNIIALLHANRDDGEYDPVTQKYKFTLHFSNDSQILNIGDRFGQPYAINYFSGSIVIPDTVTSLGKMAFSGDINENKDGWVIHEYIKDDSHRSLINEVVLNDKLEEIGNYCFAYSKIANEIHFGSSLKTIGRGAFCRTDITGDLSIPAGVESIGEEAFMNTSMLTGSLVFADNSRLTEISKDAFKQSQISGGVKLPLGIRKIGSGAFEVCTNITNVNIPISVTDINNSAFKDCNNLASVTYQGTKKSWKKIGGAEAETLKNINPTFENKVLASFDALNDEVSDYQILSVGDRIVKPSDPVREGYSFAGWYTDASYTKEWNFDSDRVADENVNLIAKWKDHYNVTLKLNDGRGDVIWEIPIGETLVDKDKPVREGYTFTGYYLDEACTRAFSEDTEITNDITLYAGWKAIGKDQDDMITVSSNRTSFIKGEKHDLASLISNVFKNTAVKDIKVDNEKILKKDKKGYWKFKKIGSVNVEALDSGGKSLGIFRLSVVKKPKLKLSKYSVGDTDNIYSRMGFKEKADSIDISNSSVVTISENGDIRINNTGKSKITLHYGNIKIKGTVKAK